MSKNVLKSKTVWINLIVGILGFFPSIQAFITPEVLTQILVVVNIILRLVTKDKISLI